MILFLVGCAKPTSECEKLDINQSKQVVIDYYQAMSDKNFEAMKSVSTSDFIIYEDGKIWNNDSLISLISTMPEASVTFDFKDFNFETDCNSAFVYYLNHGVITMNDTTRIEYHWIESAYIKKFGEELKLDFLNSTVAK